MNWLNSAHWPVKVDGEISSYYRVSSRIIESLQLARPAEPYALYTRSATCTSVMANYNRRLDIGSTSAVEGLEVVVDTEPGVS